MTLSNTTYLVSDCSTDTYTTALVLVSFSLGVIGVVGSRAKDVCWDFAVSRPDWSVLFSVSSSLRVMLVILGPNA